MATPLSSPISNTRGCLIFPKTRARCDIRPTSAKLPRNHSEFLDRFLLWPLVWVFNLVGLVDLVNATARAVSVNLPAPIVSLPPGASENETQPTFAGSQRDYR